jgi:ElaB/YqjD/DUF883 family membrane-anchored ribosome-binding protein
MSVEPPELVPPKLPSHSRPLEFKAESTTAWNTAVHVLKQNLHLPYGGQPKDNSRSSGNVSGALEHGKEAIGNAATDAMNSAGPDFQSLRNDLNALTNTVTKFVSEAGSEAAKSAQQITSTVAGRVGDVASGLADKGAEMAGAATGQAKTLASELENMARRNPLGVIAGAVVVGLLIGTMGRRS